MNSLKPALKPALVYTICATAWVIGNDWLFEQLTPDNPQLRTLHLIQDGLFIAASAVLLFAALRKAYRTQLLSSKTQHANEERLRLALESARQGLWDWDLASGEVFFSERYCQMIGFSQSEFGNSRADWEKRIHPDDLQQIRQFVDHYLAQPSTDPYEATYRIRHADGEYRWIRALGQIIRDEHGALRFIGTVLDVTNRRADKTRLRQLKAIFDCTHEGVLITDASKKIVYCNETFSQITGYHLDDILGQAPSMLQSGHHDRAFYQQMWHSIVTQDAWSGEIWNRRKNGETFPLWQSIQAVRDEQNILTHYVAVFSDISEIKHSEQELAFLSHHDPLSGLPNRLLVSERLEQAIEQAKRLRLGAGLILLDLDNFKLINESFDHSLGDQLIKLIGERLRKVLPSTMTLGRLGGDEFAIVVPSIVPPKGLGELPQQLLAAFEEPIEVAGETLFMSASLGISLYPQDGNNFDSLFRNADAALFQAKGSGRKTFSFYNQEMTAQSRHRLRLEGDLRHALSNQELQVYYQPIHRLSDHQLVGVEALVRWLHPERGLISPAEFIPVAEDSGLIKAIDLWVLNQACQQMQLWLEQGQSLEFVAVNVSSRLFIRSELEQHVRQALQSSGLPAHHLELEVTESAMMDDPQAALVSLEHLRQLGVHTAIDDFGTGYSSMARLKSLPLDKLKIDQSFIAGLPQSKGDAAIVQAVITLGKSLGLRVLAEGIENEQQAEFLLQHGCLLGQGYWFGRPLPATQSLTQYNLKAPTTALAPDAIAQ